ncbi:unnamed protein product [Didymodactylos carnosus]|uniref:Multifunctional fusion protein n=2 Tax=Didymodactylos carnosus TaxID=1234261 RepID=A0A814LB26_9BILA|nr:unnamed protein product [Didymodactylos carnosus]CAF3831424.1 unnamed protein product [Didymodactylos carnosus]
MGNKTPESAPTSTAGAAHIQSGSQHERSAQQRRNLESNTIVWLDANVSSSDDNVNAKVRLRQAINHVETFEDKQKCIDHIVSLESEQIYFIVSGSLGESVVPLIHEKPQIESIYVFCFTKGKHEEWAKHYEKVCAVATNIDDICDQLTKDVVVSSNNLVSMTAVSPNTNGKEINKQEVSFMYFQLLVSISTELAHKDSMKQELIDLCRMEYAGNDKELNAIDQFHKTYSKEQAIEWYMKDCFLYRILNKALRIQDIDMLFKLGFFIRDLQEELGKLQKSATTRLGRTITVYRGLEMSNKEFESTEKKVGGLLLMNSFLSTTAQEAVALRFARRLGRTDTTPVLFEMTVDTEKCRQPFSSIKAVSDFSAEEKILFSIGTVFRIVSIKQLNKEDVWNVKLELNGDEDIELSMLTNHIKRELGESNNLNTLGTLLITMGENSKAKQYFQMLLDDTSLDQIAHASVYHNIGLVHDNQGDYEKALKSYEKSLEIKLISLPPNHPDIAATYNNMGLVHKNQGDYEEALKTYEKSLEIKMISLQQNHPSIATTYNNIGEVHDNQGDYEKALKSYEKALEIYLISLPPNHPSIAATYNNIGLVYNNQGDYEKALKSYEKSLEIYLISLPPNHPDITITYNNIGSVYNNQGDYEKAVKFFEKSLEIYLVSLPLNHHHIATTYDNIGSVYDNEGDYEKALEYYEKALSMARKTLPLAHSTLRTIESSIATVRKKLSQ